MAAQPPAGDTPDRRTPDTSAHPVRHGTLILTNVIKVTGLIFAIHDVLFLRQPDSATLALAAFMMAGAQISEGIALALIDRFLGPPAK